MILRLAIDGKLSGKEIEDLFSETLNSAAHESQLRNVTVADSYQPMNLG